ncbi:Transcriptional repressor tup12-related protein [Tritrichomonas foetus]|uniref:Transcriptional repressor tup12-related protein n=1 Tax=Tritrichomonas foetus TaxID=1144522 RepID=A0A1J4KFV7_9EUKA|nr:Transcriptional repressor tup12-related protein [Tritrichomonas foetus]|eukprot:OHT10295.1 Transcriptional repressor tup12-related protein [Tritrichomonas foetus]
MYSKIQQIKSFKMDQGFLIHETSALNDHSADKIFDKITEIEKSVCKLRAETADLQRLKSQSQIYLQMYQNDYESLKSLYKTLKDRMNAFDVMNNLPGSYQNDYSKSDLAENKNFFNKQNNYNNGNYAQQQNQMESMQTMQIASASGNSLSHIELQWDIMSNDKFYNKSTVHLRYALNTSSVLCSVQFDSTGKRFAFADGRTVFLINTADGSLLSSFDIPHILSQTEIHTRALCFSPDDNYILISATNNSIIVFSIPNRSLAVTLKEHTGLVSSLLFLPDGKLLSGGFDGTLCIWDLKTCALVNKIQHGSTEEAKRDKSDLIISLAMAYDQSFVAVGFMNGSVGIYEPSFSQPMNTFNAHTEFMLNVSTANKSLLLATSSHDNSTKLWSLRGVASCKHTLLGHTNCVLTSSFSNDDSILFTGSKDENIKAWDVKTGNLLFTLTAHKNTLFEVDHHPLEKCFVTCSGDGIVCLWDYTSKK